MSKYISHSVGLTENQKTKLRRAVKQGSTCSFKLSHAHLSGSHPLPLTQTQINHLHKARADGVGYVLNLSVAQVKHIHEGGFLPLILGALGALATGALSGAAGYAANRVLTKVVDGHGFGESYIQNASAVGKGNKKKQQHGMGMGFSTGQGLFQYGQPPARGRGMVPL